jgi:hypothetical protein
MGATRVWTKMLSGSLTIASEMRVQRISLQVISGVTGVTGNLTFAGLAPDTINFATGEGVTLTSEVFGNTIDGLTINSSGVCRIILTVN